MVDVAVVGGGIAGLSAAWELVGSGACVSVFESTDRVGGKLRTENVAGTPVDVGAESMLGRRPEVQQLLAELDLTPSPPAQVGASIWSRGALRAMPKGTLMGVPSDASTLAGLLGDAEVARAADEQTVRLDTGGDISVGDAVEQAFGPAVVDRLVEPLLGGVYAGDARYLSLRACVPALYDAVQHGNSLGGTAAAASRQPAVAAADQPPVFAGLRGGIGSLPTRLSEALHAAGAQVRVGTLVTGIDRDEQAGRWRLVLGDGTTFDADAIVLATPAPSSAKLLATLAPGACDELRAIEYASMAVVTYAFPASARELLGEQSGFLVPPVDGRRIKASTFSSVKWPWLAQESPDLVFVRVSAGRFRETEALRRPDALLAADGLAELRTALGPLPTPVAAHVRRWGGGLPQYATGHIDLVARLRRELSSLPAVSVAGAAYDGVGIPACIGSGRTAARTVLDQLNPSEPTEGRS
ncbi:oxygen-dependent protoporphyrinogen oxidase [Yimella lutea]|uniref:Coproporphyrinogen III oxidase n=1 Tax=Yimella lutea TaxID=587872 RepID=A0A542EG44_9MICO|nr:protoporphyrinogen oxidase [Yimella lutea]TQJ14321.1 oxygen-dependent protoporphyrinogen oxidase [Yimella lutea]